MDEKEVLTRFKNGHLDRAQVAALLAGDAAAADTGTGTGPAPVVFRLPEAWPEPDGAEPSPAAASPAAGRGADSASGAAAAPATPATPLAAPAPDAGPIAVVGMAGRYPGAPDLAAFWRLARGGHDSAAEPPAGRPGDERGHYLERVQDFDPEFFGIDADEAALIDPQERLFLETAWEALEDAGCTGGRLDALTAGDGTPRSVGVFTGAGTGDYVLLAARTWRREQPRPMPGGGRWSLPNRLSALLGLTGPSQSVDTAESSVLVALHQAVAALHRGECAAALVGGVRLLLHPSSRRPGAGEGVGALLLKPLARALADGDTVHCLIRGSAVGHTAPDPSAAGPGRGSRAGGGRARAAARAADSLHASCPVHGTDGGHGADLAAPAAPAERVLREALRAAGLDASAAAVREDAGSVRALVGDAGSATGAAALTRAVLELSHRILAPEPGRIEAQPWENATAAPRRICVGVRGAGGADAQVVLEEYLPGADPVPDPVPEAAPEAARELFVLSAPTPAHLAATAGRFAELLDGPGPVPPLPALARALRTGRSAMDCRFAAVVTDTGELVRALERFVRDGAPCADLRDGGADPLDLGGVPETDGYLAALWRAGHLDQLRGLWLSGLDIDWTALEPARGAASVAVPLPASAFLRVPLWLGGEEGSA
ncbi:beta-ketoacyl [acyl carrier protein] synthase domain-containing protein [Streptomyces sp. NBC_00239]|uniref:beta-ketoacyl [acyl carrier protein] synthase domain-containing protein n=1 Tax=Streptomyces sp. NBC_00239 TaxID=2903640 RepID=UPI002E28BD51|nr:polyketide synthase [Streptomyces sp. NBC_00239]